MLKNPVNKSSVTWQGFGTEFSGVEVSVPETKSGWFSRSTARGLSFSRDRGGEGDLQRLHPAHSRHATQ